MKLILVIAILLQAAFANAQTEKVKTDISGIKNTLKMPDTTGFTAIKQANIERAAKTQFNYFVIKADSSTYGYSIYANGSLYIQQNTIPGIAGTKGFTSAASAATIAQLAISKIKQGEMPPTITPQELATTIKNL
jgi:hypothetical protein